MPENRRLDQKKAQQIIGERFSFAGVEELLSVTECIPGAVPPFGSAISLKTYADHRLQQARGDQAGLLIRDFGRARETQGNSAESGNNLSGSEVFECV